MYEDPPIYRPCQTGFHIEGFECVRNVCKCSVTDKLPAQGIDCVTHNSEVCVECPDGRHKVNLEERERIKLIEVSTFNFNFYFFILYVLMIDIFLNFCSRLRYMDMSGIHKRK